MHDTITLQLASSNDAPAIARLSADQIEHGLPHTWTAQRIRAHIRHRDSIVLVAKYAVDVLGFAIMHFGDRTAHLNLLAVCPRARRRGIARQMLAWLHESASVAGTFIVSLELRADNVAARRFYASMWYEECGIVPKYYDGVEDAIRMSRDLTVRSIE
jgi:ribosomal protein S18 acetylase RimI-like enzyme